MNIEQEYRERREKECFPYINRGPNWHNHLTEAQAAELDEWYQAWLDVTETKTIPTKPEWIKQDVFYTSFSFLKFEIFYNLLYNINRK